MDLNSRRILDPALAEHLALIEDTDEIADAVAEVLGLVILRPDDYDPKKVVSYVYLWINFTRLRAGAVPFLYIGSRRFSGDPATDNYQGSNVSLNRDQAAGDDCRKYILETFEVDEGDAFALEAVILHDLDVMVSVEFYNRSNGADGFDSETASAIAKKSWAMPDERAKRLVNLQRLQTDSEIQAKKSVAMKLKWSDSNSEFNKPEFKNNLIKTLQRPDVASARNAALQRPDVKAKRSSSIKSRWSDPNSGYNKPEFLDLRSEISKNQMRDPMQRLKTAAGTKKTWQDPQIAAARRQRFWNDPFYIAHISYYDEWSRRAETGDFEHCDTCGKVITVEPIRASQKITCFFCENPLQDGRN